MKKCLFCGLDNEDETLFCKGCGRKFPITNKKVCKSISDEINDKITIDTQRKQIYCPDCKSTHLQATVETSTSVRTTGNNYSLEKGIIGRLLFGTPGFLLGSVGKKQRTYVDTQNRNYQICSDCGNKFRNIEDWSEEINHKEQAAKVNLVLTIIFSVIAVMFFTGGEVSTIIGVIFLIIGAAKAVMFLLSKIKIQKELQELETLKKASTEQKKYLKTVR